MPSVVVVTERFKDLAMLVARGRRRPDFPIIVLPASMEEIAPEAVRDLADRTLGTVLQALVQPPPPQRAS
ncbi:MAG: hypothetical protein HY684_03640 [Chloroflexi bacterium]|nr:hypothetical protein [Chloroflexota bacterium]